MKIKKQSKKSNPSRGYELIITTMEGDADDEHSVEFLFNEDEEDELRKHIIACEVVAKTYTNGRGGGDNYKGEYWDLISEDWPYECNDGFSDSFDYWDVVFHDGNGGIYPCEIELDEEAKEEIKNAPEQK